MPHITFKNVSSNDVKIFIENTTDALAKTIECPSDWLIFYDSKCTAIIDKQEDPKTCYIKVEWFNRPAETRDKVALIIDSALRELGKNEVVIQFSDIDNNNYYENMEKFK